MSYKRNSDHGSLPSPSLTSLIQPLGSSCLARPMIFACCHTRRILLAQLAKAHRYKIGWRRCPVALFVALRSALIHAWLPAFVCWAFSDLLVQARYSATPDEPHIIASFLRTRQKICAIRHEAVDLFTQPKIFCVEFHGVFVTECNLFAVFGDP